MKTKIVALIASMVMIPVAQSQSMKIGQEKAVACQGCHGSNGVSINGIGPHLAGQTASYIERQLKNFKSKSRQYAPMNAMAAGLSDEDIDNLAAFFAAQSLSVSNPVDRSLAGQGKAKAAMCLGCHGGKAEGRGQFPRLAGQKPQYLEKQLRDFKAGKRQGGPMNAVAKGLSEQDISALSHYFASLK